MQNFSFTNDFKKVNWGDTVMYNLLRGTSAGLIIGLLISFNAIQTVGSSFSILQVLSTILTFMVGIPIVLLIYFIPYNLILNLFNNYSGGGVLFVLRIISFIFAIIPAMGDPLIRILLNYYPNLIDIEKPSWFQNRIIIFVLR